MIVFYTFYEIPLGKQTAKTYMFMMYWNVSNIAQESTYIIVVREMNVYGLTRGL